MDNINYLTYRSKSCNNIFDKNDNNKFYNIYKKYESLKINNGNNIIYAFSNKQNSAIHKDIKEKTILRENTYDNKNNLKHEINDFQFFAYNKSNKNINKKIIDRYGEENYLISDNYELFKIKKTNLQKTSFQVFIKSNNYSKIQYLNIIKDLNKKIMQLENEMRQSKIKIVQLMNYSRRFQNLNINYIDSFSYDKTEQSLKKIHIFKNIIKNNSNFEENSFNYKESNDEINHLFFHKINPNKKYYEIEADKLNIKKSDINNRSISKSVIYKKKILKNNLTNNKSFRQMSFDFNYNNINYIKIENILNNTSINYYYNINNNKKNKNKIYNNIIYTLYPYSIKKILSFSLSTRKFTLEEYIDTCSFKKNVILNNEQNEKCSNAYLNHNGYFYIVTGKNYNMFYIYNPSNKTMKKLENLNFNHKNGNLVSFHDKIFCISGDYTKKVEKYSELKDKWNIISELNKIRSNFNACIFEDRYLFVFFGYDAYSKEYINSIEYIDLIKNNSKWKYLNYKNNFNISSFLTNIIAIPIENNILLFGGYNNKKELNEYYQLNLEFLNSNYKNIITIEKFHNNLIFNENNNNAFMFDCNLYKYYDENNNILYTGFDHNFQVHIFREKNFQHEIYTFN